MSHPDIDFMIVMERRRDELTEAANYRLIKEAESVKRLNHPVSLQSRYRQLNETLMLLGARFLSTVGERMLNWSCQLHYHYELLAESSAEKRPSPCS